jgi:glycosyltransferase involved in cell wall biosynthesis
MKILYFSSVSYNWMKQRPQFVAELLSKRYETDYITCTPLGKRKEQSKQKAPLPTRDIYVLPFALRMGIVRLINKLWLNFCVRFKKYDLVIATHPVQFAYIPKSKKVIYECMDLTEGFYEGNAKKEIIRLEQLLISESTHIICSANTLKKKLLEKGAVQSKITVIKNAVDKSWAFTEATSIALNHPNLLYVGTISKWFDMDTILKFCKQKKDHFVYIVGKCDLELNECPPNLIFVDKVPHSEVRRYIKSADILLLPFKTNELTDCVDPVKMYEYLSFNKPVISTFWDELSEYKNNPNVHFYKNYNEFLAATDTTSKPENINKQFVYDNCWEERIKEYYKIIEAMF